MLRDGRLLPRDCRWPLHDQPLSRTARHRLSPAGGQPFALLPASTFAWTRAATHDHAGSRRLHPGPASRSPSASMRTATSGLSGRTRLRTWASGWPPSRRGRSPEPSPRPGARCAARLAAQPRRRPGARRARAEVMGKGGGRAIMKGKWWAGGPARAAAVLTRAGQCG